MTIDANDPRLTAYALGELDADETREIEQLLAQSPELETLVEEIRQAGSLLSASFDEEPTITLTEEQRAAIGADAAAVSSGSESADEAAESSPSPALPASAALESTSPLFGSRFLVATAATLMLVLFGAMLWESNRHHIVWHEEVERTTAQTEGQTLPSPYYLNDGIQYFPPDAADANADHVDTSSSQTGRLTISGGGSGVVLDNSRSMGGDDGSFIYDDVLTNVDASSLAEFKTGHSLIVSSAGESTEGTQGQGRYVEIEPPLLPTIQLPEFGYADVATTDRGLRRQTSYTVHKPRWKPEVAPPDTSLVDALQVRPSTDGDDGQVSLEDLPLAGVLFGRGEGESEAPEQASQSTPTPEEQVRAVLEAQRRGFIDVLEQQSVAAVPLGGNNVLNDLYANDTAAAKSALASSVRRLRASTLFDRDLPLLEGAGTAYNRIAGRFDPLRNTSDDNASVDLAKPGPTRESVLKKLHNEVRLPQQEKTPYTFEDIVDTLSVLAGTPIVIDDKSLDEIGISPTDRIRYEEGSKAPLRQVLANFLSKLDPELCLSLEYGYLTITTIEHVSQVSTDTQETYLVQDLVLPLRELQKQASNIDSRVTKWLAEHGDKKNLTPEDLEQYKAITMDANALRQRRGEIVSKHLARKREALEKRLAQFAKATKEFETGKTPDTPEARQQYRVMIKERRLVEEAYQRLTGRPSSWRRSRATPNASRLMIGEKEELPLEGLQANVQIDGFRARVLLDYYFYNDRDQQFEGTFKLRLPNGASLYFFAFGETAYEYRPNMDSKESPGIAGAFFNINEARGAGTAPAEILKLRQGTWNAPKVARIVPKEKAAHAYHETVRRKVDPALVEWSGAGIFSARVFPLAAKKLHRIVVGYDVDLTRIDDKLQYQLDLPEGVLDTVVDINLSATAGGSATVEPNVEPFVSNGRAYYNIREPLSRRVTVNVDDAGNTLIAGHDKPSDTAMFAASVVADLPTDEADNSSPQAVFLLDTSLSSNPDKFNVYLKLLESTLSENRDSLDSFAVLLFNIENHWWQPKFVKNTPENVKQLIAYAHTLSLEGATDLGAALQQAARPDWFVTWGKARKWDVFLLSDGALNWGQQSLHQLSSTLTGVSSQAGSLFAYNTKMAGTASRVLQHLARETGGSVFSVAHEAEIKKVARAHRQRPWQLEAVEVEGVTGDRGSDLLIAGRPTSVYPDQQLLVVGRGEVPRDAAVVLKVRRGEESKAVRLNIDRRVDSTLAPRTYGQVAVGQLESLGDMTEDVSVAYARHFRVTGQTCSLLMLESEADYERFNIKPEDDAFVVRSSLASRVVTEALEHAAQLLADPKATFQAWLAKLEKMPGATFKISPAMKIAVNSLSDKSFAVPSGQLRCQQMSWDGMPSDLKKELSQGKVNYDRLQTEATRRMAEYGSADALRTISSLVENSPGNLVLIRDVAYSAMEWEMHDQAYHLLHRVASARPYEPQMYLAMAQSLAGGGHNDLAMLYYETASAGQWDGRFGEVNHIVDVDYLHFLRQVASGQRKVQLSEFAAARLSRLADKVKIDQADVVVAIMWNTDGTDVDLHVKEPTGEVCFYSNPKTKIGGKLTRDCTQGFGPELYVLQKAVHGKYDIQVKYFSSDANRASTRTKVFATVYEGWGTKQEQATRRAVHLTTGKEMHQVAVVGVEK